MVLLGDFNARVGKSVEWMMSLACYGLELKQMSMIDYVITDAQLMAASGNVKVDNTNIGCSDHFLVWMGIGRLTNRSRKKKHVIKR